MNILYHGRFQPPHSGHIKLCKFYLKLFPDAKLYISIDSRKKDKNNPYSYEYRKKEFIKQLKEFLVNSNLEKRIFFLKHEGHLLARYCLQNIYKNLWKNWIGIDLVIHGPSDNLLAKNSVIDLFWKNKNIQSIYFPCRIDNISGTKIRRYSKYK